MKLFLNAASPYARLVRVVLVETGLQAETELHYVDLGVFSLNIHY